MKLLPILTAVLFLTVAPVSAITLQQAIEKALAYDPTIRIKLAERDQSVGFSDEIRADRRPHIAFNAGSGWVNRDRSIDGVSAGGGDLWSRQASLIGRQLLYDGRYSWLRWKDARERQAAEELLLQSQREETALATTEAYLDVLRAQRQIDLARENVRNHQGTVNLASERAEGAGDESDAQLAGARLQLAKTLLRERELALKQAEARYMRWVGERPNGLIVPNPPAIRSLEDIDITQNWHYRAVLKQREAAHYIKKALQRAHHPRLNFEASGGVGEDVLGVRGPDNEASALLVVNWDLFEGGRKKAQVRQAIADIEKQQAVADETLVLLRKDRDARWAEYVIARDRVGILRDYHEGLTETNRIYGEQFEFGKRQLLNVLDLKNERIDSAIRLVDEEHKHIMLAYRLLFYGGLLTRAEAADLVATTDLEERVRKISGRQASQSPPPAQAAFEPAQPSETVPPRPTVAATPTSKPAKLSDRLGSLRDRLIPGRAPKPPSNLTPVTGDSMKAPAQKSSPRQNSFRSKLRRGRGG